MHNILNLVTWNLKPFQSPMDQLEIGGKNLSGL